MRCVSTDAPNKVSVSVSAPGGTVEGNSMTLTCSSYANPPWHNFTWFQTWANETVVRGTGERITFTSLSSSDSGVYHCEGQNEVGALNSTGVEITVASK